MVGSNADAFDQLDQFWDETIRDHSSRPPDLDPGLASAVRRLHRLNEAVVPGTAFTRRTWTDLSQSVAMTQGVRSSLPLVIPSRSEESSRPLCVRRGGTIPHCIRNDGARSRIARIGWQGGFAQVLMVAVLMLTFAAGYAAVRLRPTSHDGWSPVADAGDIELYSFVFDGTGESETDSWDIVPLDPMSLEDRAPTSKQPAWASTLAEKWSTHLWALSADGSTYVAVETRAYVNGVRAKESIIGIYDAQTGTERTHIDLPTAVYHIRLSRDGSRLVIQAHPITPQVRAVGMRDPPVWYAVDTSDGNVIATVASDELNGWHDDAWIDPEAQRLYRLFIPFSQENTGPGATRIVANDLTTGEEIGQLELPEVRSGVWWTDRTHAETGGVEYPVIAELRPGVALSPDGKTLALVHADEDAVTIVDAERLVVERTEPLTRPIGWGDRLLGLLRPDDAAAKGPGEGTVLRAVFAADGRHLYVYGAETTFDEDGADSQSLGLRLIDLETAEIVADELAGGFFSDVMPSPNGRDLYVIGSQPPDVMWSDDVPTRLWRLDAATLGVLTTRDFPETPRIILSPAVPDGRGQMPPGAG